MFHSLLIIGGNKEKRWQFALKVARENLGENQASSHPDFFLITGLNSIGIEQVRELERKLALKPYQAVLKVIIINEAEKLTLPAQNALLKTLEEPPEDSLIILTAPQKNSLELPEIRGKRVGECLKIASGYLATKDKAVNFCQQLLLKERGSFINEPSVKRAKNIRYILKTIRFLESNVNPILATGNLLLKLIK